MSGVGAVTIKAKFSNLLAPRPWLLPLAPLYLACARLHRRWMLFRDFPFDARIPLVVVGALKAGGSGKTSVTLELARALRARGLEVAVLAYRLNGGAGGDLSEVFPDSSWREESDEAVLLRRQGGARVFTTRHRARAWRALHDAPPALGRAGRPFDIILSDDGFQDPRLGGPSGAGRGAFRLLLAAPGEKPALRDLLPAGPYRETHAAAARADRVAVEGRDFVLRARLPAGFDRARPWVLLSGLGDNARFAADMRAQGVRVAETLALPDHGTVSPRRLAACLGRHRGAGILCTRKDAVKLGVTPPGVPVAVAERETGLDPALIEAVEAYREGFRHGETRRFRESALVDYPR